MARIVTEFDSCYDCPYAKTERYYTSDSFEYALTYRCGKVKHVQDYKKIADYIERKSDMPDIPIWCPILDEDERNERIKTDNGKFQGECI